jgi:hypothetical protein
MTEYIGRTRVWTSWTGFILTEPFDEVLAAIERNEGATFTSVTGQAMMPPERIWFARGAILSLQECSAESWVWQQQADELHYARRLQELGQDPGERLAAAQERLVEVFSGGGDDE